jgi:hypothetical protein
VGNWIVWGLLGCLGPWGTLPEATGAGVAAELLSQPFIDCLSRSDPQCPEAMPTLADVFRELNAVKKDGLVLTTAAAPNR